MNTPLQPAALAPREAVLVFLSFALAYFFSALVRAITATLAPTFSAELGLTAGDLGLLAGAYFLGFAALQLPLGDALDRFGPRRVLLSFLAVAVAGNVAFALASNFASLIVARVAIGVGVSACLMAPMTAFRLRLAAQTQFRATSWMLMTGSLGMLASTLPVQWLLPSVGWRGLFWLLAAGIAVAMAGVALLVPVDPRRQPGAAGANGGYRQVFRDATFVRFAPMGFFHYGGLVAVQTLWAGPWLTQVCGWSADEAALGLFAINAAMLATFLVWGFVITRLHARGATPQGIVKAGLPPSLVVLALAIALGPAATAWVWACFCVASTFVALSQPTIGMAVPSALAGRALSAFNLIIFSGVFAVQWGIGLVIDAMRAAGADTVSAFRVAFAILGLGCVLSYAWFVWRDDRVVPALGAERR